MDADGNKTGGRQKGTPNKATAAIRTLALAYGPEALRELARLAGLTKGDDDEPIAGAASDAARISAIGMMLERAYGRPLAGQSIQVDLPDTSTIEGVTSAVAALVQAAASGEITPRKLLTSAPFLIVNGGQSNCRK